MKKTKREGFAERKPVARRARRSNPGKLDLDVHAPSMVAPVLRAAADSFYESATELEGAWQSKQAGRPWVIIARKLEACAEQIEKALKKVGW